MHKCEVGVPEDRCPGFHVLSRSKKGSKVAVLGSPACVLYNQIFWSLWCIAKLQSWLLIELVCVCNCLLIYHCKLS